MTSQSEFRKRTLLTPLEVSTLIGVPHSTLSRWRSERSHLPYVHLGRRVMYRMEDIDAFINGNLCPVEEDAR